MKNFIYCGIERYESRYSWQLWDWTKRVLERRHINYIDVQGDRLEGCDKIVTGQVLDAHGRSYYSLTQISKLVKLMQSGNITSDDVIFFEDMFTPGMESLAYILDQTPAKYKPKIFVRCLAQSIDPDDFVNSTGMFPWMKHYEKMVNNFVTGILATNEEMVANTKIAGWLAPIYNISGLSYGKEEVLERVEQINAWDIRSNRVVFAARWDKEKQPHFYMDLIEKWYKTFPTSTVEFSVLCGGEFKSNDITAVDRARNLEVAGYLDIIENLSKNDYYWYLNNSKVGFNCALQDWWSNTLNEFDTLGCNVLYPAYRSFSESLSFDKDRLYIPWSIDDAIEKLAKLLKAPHKNIGKVSNWSNGTIDRILDICEGNGEQWNRSNLDYRKYVADKKY